MTRSCGSCAPGTDEDNLEATNGATAPSGHQVRFGRVSYFHAGGIDRPLTITKDAQNPIIPHQSWRGQFAWGSWGKGTYVGQRSDCTSSNQTNCVNVAWPGWQTNAWHVGGNPGEQEYWMGSLADGKRDATGQIYMRDRYYDPATGQFTQQDPSGLAGGLNAYGFAAGDPVSYSDPYGLCAQSASQDTIPGVEVCSEVADLPGNNIFKMEHQWLRTDQKEAGLGEAGRIVPGEGEYRSPFLIDTEVTDHSGRGTKSTVTCRPAPGADPVCVNARLQIGQPRGRWSPANQCQTFVQGIIRACSIPRTVAPDAAPARPRLREQQ